MMVFCDNYECMFIDECGFCNCDKLNIVDGVCEGSYHSGRNATKCDVTGSDRKLTADQVRKCVQHIYYEGYSDGFVHRGAHVDETNWQAVAEKLNELRSETCEWHKVHIGGRLEGYECECGQMLPDLPKICPNCEKKVVIKWR